MSYKVNVICRKNSYSFAYNSKYAWLISCMVYYSEHEYYTKYLLILFVTWKMKKTRHVR